MSPDRVSLPGNSPAPVLVVGSVAYDDIHTPFGYGARILGGSASYASLAASYFSDVRLVGIVGHDFDPAHRARLAARGIDLSGLQVDGSGETFFWAGRYHENFDRRDTIETRLNVFEHFQPTLPPTYRATPFVLLGNIMPKLQSFVLDQLDSQAFVLADTMDLWVQHTRDDLLALMPRVDLFLINDDEATQLTGEANPILAGRALLRMGPKQVVVKKGSHGALLFSGDGSLFALPAYPVTELRDPTGAGDSFAGALLGYLAATGDLSPASFRRAMAYATVTASLTVEAFSCDRLESAGAEAVAARYQELLTMVHIDE